MWSEGTCPHNRTWALQLDSAGYWNSWGMSCALTRIRKGLVRIGSRPSVSLYRHGHNLAYQCCAVGTNTQNWELFYFWTGKEKNLSQFPKIVFFYPKNRIKERSPLFFFINKGCKNMQSETQNAPIAFLFGFRIITKHEGVHKYIRYCGGK